MSIIGKAKAAFKPVSIAAGKLMTKAKIKSPKLLIFGGITVMVAGTVYACAKTPEAVEEIKEAKENIEKAETKGQKIKAGAKGLGKTMKVYVGPMIVTIGGAGMILGGWKIIDTRLTTVSAMVVAAENRYKTLYSRVKDRFGEEQANQLADGTITVTTSVTNKEGKEEKKIVQILPEGVTGFGPYSYVWEECNLQKGIYSEDPWRNKMFLISAQERCNQLLREQGYIFLNQVLQIFGFKYKTRKGQLVGWIYSDKSRLIGDHAVDCGVAISKNNAVRHPDYLPHIQFLEGKEPNVLLDFNCDGYILDEVERLGLF